MKRKIKKMIDTFSRYDTDTKIFIMLLISSSTAILVLLTYYLQRYVGLILMLALVIMVFAWDAISNAYQRIKHPNGTCESSCIGCDAVYHSILTTVYDALKIVSPILHLSIPPTERQTQTICPPRPDGLPRCAFRVMRKTEEEPISDEDILSCFRQTLQDSFVSHGASFLCTGVKDLYVEEVKQDDFAITFFIMPYCPSCTATHIDRLRMREQMQRERQSSKREDHIYDDQI